MKNILYKCFDHWFHGGQIWLYSDPHFNDPEMRFLRHNYIGDDEQIKRINSKVGKKDTIIFLGDIGDLECVKRIRGYKVLIMGNHDTGATKYREVFDEVYEGLLTISEKIVLSHEPVKLTCMFNIHGHDHSNHFFSKDNNHLNLCAEHIDYTPVSLINLVKDGTFKNVVSIHRMAIDRRNLKK